MEETLTVGVDWIMLDNMDLDTMAEAVRLVHRQGEPRPVLEASGNVIRFKEFGMQSEGNIAAKFHDNGDVTGAYGEFAGFMDNNYQFHDVMAFYKFKVDKSEKVYCRSYLSAVELTFAGGPSGGGSYDDMSGGGDGGGAGAGGRE